MNADGVYRTRPSVTAGDETIRSTVPAAIGRDFVDREMPFEVRRLDRTIMKWAGQICAWHHSHVTNGPTEAINNLVKRVKRVAFGLTNFRHHRIRCLLYASKPNWDLLPTIQP